ncbi:unnamed protein product [Owenia fusiformis]|uniref:Uncharacterized protein n=1 Tax=Owenia fusiformis TaxID=6347 RepID=A0A8J1U8G4_OWEFU|nr:unnamed protein product [Owenia fusiformis]
MEQSEKSPRFPLIPGGTSTYLVVKPNNNESVQPEIMLISNKEDLEQVIRSMREIDFEGEVWRHCPDTKCRPYRINHIHWEIQSEFQLGEGILPDYMRKNKGIIGLKNNFDRRPFKHKLCTFLCLA